VSFFVRKNEKGEERAGCRNLCHGKHTNKKRRKFMVTVEWENANELGIGELMEMAEDGYSFFVGDGKIKSVTVLVYPQS